MAAQQNLKLQLLIGLDKTENASWISFMTTYQDDGLQHQGFLPSVSGGPRQKDQALVSILYCIRNENTDSLK